MARFISRNRRALRCIEAVVAFAVVSVLPAALSAGPAAAIPTTTTTLPPNGCQSLTYVPVSCALTLSSAIDPQGSTVIIGGTGFAPFTHVTLYLGSTYLGSAFTNSAGDFIVPEVIPYSAPLGSTYIEAVGTNKLGGNLVLYAHLVIVPPVHHKTPTTTKVYESQPWASYGNENSVAFTVVVTPDYGPSGGPSGDPVTIKVGFASCVAKLFNGAGNCSIGASALPVGGHYPVSATFFGDFRFAGSSSTNALNFAVIGKPGTRTTVFESRSFGIYGLENTVGFTAHVIPSSGGFGGGLDGDSVTINIGTASCVATLLHGLATCAIGSRALPVGGPYPVTATFAGDTSYGGSTSTNTLNFAVGKASHRRP
jgi:hypothetical protein